jgi:hypothetical protein
MFLLNFALAPVAVVLGVIAIRRAIGQPTSYGGTRRSLAGILLALGSLALVIGVAHARRAEYGPWGGVVRSNTRACLEQIGKSLREYALANEAAFPPDLTYLSTGYLAYPDVLRLRYCSTPNTATDWDYVAELNPDVPADWILAYAHPQWFNNEGGPVLYVDGTVKLLSADEFERELRAFTAAHQRARGAPPTIIPAH